MKKLLTKVAAHHAKNLPFAMYCAPKDDIVNAYLQQTDELNIIKDFGESGFAFCSFDDTKQYFISESGSEFLSESKVGKGRKPALQETKMTNDGKTAFVQLVENAVAKIRKGDLMKVVVSRKESVAAPSFDFIRSYAQLISNYPNAYCYCFFHPKVGMWLGATPERLLNIDGKKFRTVALAGTQPRVDKYSVIWKDKEIEEQKFVSDFIEGNMQPLSTRLYISRPYTAWAGRLAHIKTDISGVLKKSSTVKRLLETLHPTPAVCGLPKSGAKDFIVDNEDYDRSFYSGFLGILNVGEITDLYVNLRCMEITEKTANIYVGCGITENSDPEKEYAETVIKTHTMMSVL